MNVPATQVRHFLSLVPTSVSIARFIEIAPRNNAKHDVIYFLDEKAGVRHQTTYQHIMSDDFIHLACFLFVTTLWIKLGPSLLLRYPWMTMDGSFRPGLILDSG